MTIRHSRRSDKMRACLLILLRIGFFASHPLVYQLVQHGILSTRFACCGYFVSFVTKTNNFSVHSGPIQLSSPIYIFRTIKQPCVFMPRWLDRISEEMLLYFRYNKKLDLGWKLLLQTRCYSCSHWFWKGHGKMVFKHNFISYYYFILCS